MNPSLGIKRSVSIWIRDLHLYAGLFISPFILVFAVSTILLNHAWKPWTRTAVEKTSAPVEIPAGLKSGAEGVPAAKQILRQVNVSGEIGFVRHQPQNNRLIIPVFKPGQRITISVDLTTRTAAIERTRTDLWSTLIYLHRTPGPHNAQAPRNWGFTQAWGWLADATIYLLLFLSASGVYLWALLKAERKTGLILIGTGVLSFIVLLSVLAR
ncbi:MAG: PepSY-associated TM helix domain-containing protein [Verrucomicrobia bacterium]|nr:PepSY-associated TM helix domain-containing protein [Verrucomicrobiota bacterium]